MKKAIIVLSLVMFTALFAGAQTVTISGTQIKGSAGKNAELKCNPVKITKTMKIIKVEGNCNGFWIQKGGVVTNRFYDNKKPVGTALKPGTYYVYPNLKSGSNSANVKITLQ